MRIHHRVVAAAVIPALVGAVPTPAEQGSPAIRSGREIADILEERVGVSVRLPDVGYTWTDEDVVGGAESGTVSVTHSKVIYYFVHWGPVEVESVDADYARGRIPKLWPNEGLEVTTVQPAVVAGHPAVYAEAVPSRLFYRAFFLIWNCPESGRQFIADMNYNVAVETPRSELDAELETTLHTLACHGGAPVTRLESHPMRYESREYGLSFDHPTHWFVFDNPYGVPHPAYEGLRSRNVGSVLAWMQDMEVSLRFDWSRHTRQENGAGPMSVAPDLYQAALEHTGSLDRIQSFRAEEREVLRLGETPVLKVVGTADLERPESSETEYVPKQRLMLLVAADAEKNRLFVMTVGVDFHRENGVLLPPHRSILDRWAVELSQNLVL